MNEITIPCPLFDVRENLEKMPACILAYIDQLKIIGAHREWEFCREFLKSYARSNDTFVAYRREVERLLQWSWLIQKKSLRELNRNHIREYLEFVNNPPAAWISIKKIAFRFTETIGGERLPNPAWRPFVSKVSKSARRMGQVPAKDLYKLSNKSIEAIFAILNSLFTYLQQEDYLEINPIALVRQKRGFIQRQQSQQVTRRLSRIQWHYVITACEEMAKENVKHERTLFLFSTFYLLGVRISELATKAEMGNFAPDKRGLWWFNTIGKGNKMRDVAVPDELLSGLKRYRKALNLTPLPPRGDNTPLFPTARGKKGLGTRQIRVIVQSVFDQAIKKLYRIGKTDEADDLMAATVHWLRHTAISTEVEYRPREHIRDDVGHENPATLEKYIDTDRIARHQSAKSKPLKPLLT